MAVYKHGTELVVQICKALGLEGHTIKRVVLDFSADGLVMAYVQKFAETHELDQVAELLESDRPKLIEVANVSISDNGDVIYQAAP